jgi:hypothetical protein
MVGRIGATLEDFQSTVVKRQQEMPLKRKVNALKKQVKKSAH